MTLCYCVLTQTEADRLRTTREATEEEISRLRLAEEELEQVIYSRPNTHLSLSDPGFHKGRFTLSFVVDHQVVEGISSRVDHLCSH